MPANGPRFADFRRLRSSRYELGRCGHEIQVGDQILWCRRYGSYCAACSRRREAEVEEEDRLLSSGAYPA